MIKVAGVWELGWTTPIMEYDLWIYPLRDFEATEWIMCPISGIAKNVIEFDTINDAIVANPALVPVYVDENGVTPLTEFEHPEDVLYILGKASYSPFVANKREGRSVVIETVGNSGRLWPHQAISIVLYDRLLKHGSYDNR